jgi:hypothetical protein
MISKIMLKIDFAGQLLIAVSALSWIIIQPNQFMIAGLIFLFIIGLWQLATGLLQTIIYKDKTRQKYVITAGIYAASLLAIAAINAWFLSNYGIEILNTLTAIYFFIGTVGFAIWYFRQTIIEMI